MAACSMLVSFERSESQIPQACQCFHIALGKETELLQKAKPRQSFCVPIHAVKPHVSPGTENQPPALKAVTVDNSLAKFAAK